MSAEDTLRLEAERSLCPSCKEPMWHRRGDFTNDACRACEPKLFLWDKPYKPSAMELACRWALERIAELETRVEELEEDSPALARARERRRYNLTRSCQGVPP